MKRWPTHDMPINFHLYDRLNDGNCVIFQVVKYVDVANAMMLDSRLGYVLSKEAHELERLLVVEDEVRSKRRDLLLLGAAVKQSGIVAKEMENEKNVCLGSSRKSSHSIGSEAEQKSLKVSSSGSWPMPTEGRRYWR